MILEKFIKTLNISSDYTDFVEAFKSEIVGAYDNKIHSLYMCGSIPKGTAKPNISDADFTILCENADDINGDKLTKIKESLLNAYPFVTKIDTVVCTLDDVRSKPNEWGFWVKVVCINIYGLDLGESVPPIRVTKQFVLDLNSDTHEAIRRVSHALSHATDPKMKERYVKGYSKKLIRALYTLILEDVGEWKDDIGEMYQLLVRHLDINSTLLEYLYNSYRNSDVVIGEFQEKADEAYLYFKDKLETFST